MSQKQILERNDQRQSYYLNQRNIVLNSNDRNERIWPNANHFEITLPNAYKNVQSVKIANIVLPRFTENTFSSNNKNTKFDVSVKYTAGQNRLATIEIEEGDYTPQQMGNMLKKMLNNAYSTINDIVFDVIYNEVSKKLWFVCNKEFTFNFLTKPQYDSTDSNRTSRIDIFNKLNNWGLGSFLGFDKKNAISSIMTQEYKDKKLKLNYTDPATDVGKTIFETNTPTLNGDYIIIPDYEVRTDNTENEIYYVEIEQLNQFDEVTPDKIMDIVFTNNEVDQHTTSFFSEVIQLQGKGPANSGNGIAHFNPPLDYLNKLKIKFRHHDYSLVDLKNRDYTLVLQITNLEPDPFKVGRIRKPEFYEK